MTLLLMAEILHQLIGSFSIIFLGFYIHPRWCRISSINGIDWFSMCLGNDILRREAFDNAAR